MTRRTAKRQGRVIDAQGRGLGGVPVSNGEAIVLTDHDGRFAIHTDVRRHTHVFVTMPARCEAASGWHRSIMQWRGGDRTFILGRRPGRTDQGRPLRFSVITDIHYGEVPPPGAAATRDLRSKLQGLHRRLPDTQFIIAAGDLTDRGERENLLRVRKVFEQADRPVWPLFGNHDHIEEHRAGQSSRPWARNYLNTFGPLWYSFDRGHCHFSTYTTEDNVLTGPLIEAKQKWLGADLRLAAKRGLERIVIFHFPPTLEFAKWLARRGVRLVVTGHYHCFRTYRIGDLHVVSIPSFLKGGIDMMPRGALDVITRKGHEIRYEYVPLAPAFEKVRRMPARRVAWSKKLSHYFHRAAPVLDRDGRLYVAGSYDLVGGDAAVYCLNATTGRTIWKTPIDGAVKSVVTLDGDRLFANTQTGTLWCLDKHGGRVLWSRRLAQQPNRWINARPMASDGVVLTGHSRGGLEAFDTKRGRRIWHINADQPPFSHNSDTWPNYVAPVVHGGRALICFRGQRIDCVDITTGQPHWQIEQRWDYYIPEPVVWGDSAWLANHQPEDDLVHVDLSNGRIVAKAPARGVTVSWSAADDDLYAVVLDKWTKGQARLHCRSARSGRLRWQRILGRDTSHAYQYTAEHGPNCQAPPVRYGDDLFVACTDGTLRRFNPHSGRLRDQIDLGSPLYTAPVFADNRFWITLWSGHVVCGSL